MTVNKICVMLALSDFQASREWARRTCTDADQLAVILSELDAAERVLREFEQRGEQ